MVKKKTLKKGVSDRFLSEIDLMLGFDFIGDNNFYPGYELFSA